MANSPISRKKVLNAIEGTGGIITAIAKKCGVCRQHMSDVIHKDSKLLELVEHERERMVDTAQGRLYEIIYSKNHDKNFEAVRYILNTLGKKRGFTIKEEIEHSGELGINGTVEVNVNVGKEELKVIEDLEARRRGPVVDV